MAEAARMLSAATPGSGGDQPTSKRPPKRKTGGADRGVALPRDLADLCGPSDTGFLAPRPHTAALAALALSEAEVERFTERGYVATSQPVLTTGQLEQLRADLDELVCQQPPHPKVPPTSWNYAAAFKCSPVSLARRASLCRPSSHTFMPLACPKVDLMHELHYNEAAGSGSVLFHGLGHWRCAASFHDLLYLDAVCLPASQLLQGRPVRFWHDQVRGMQLHHLWHGCLGLGVGLKRGLKRGLEPQGPRPSP